MLQGKREVIKHSAAIHIQNNITFEGAWRRVARARGTGPEKRSAPRAGQRLAGVVASRWRPPARSLRGRDRRD